MLHPSTELADFICQPNPAVLAVVCACGRPMGVPVRYVVEVSGSILLTVPDCNPSFGWLDQLRANPNLSLTITGRQGWLDSVSLTGAAFEVFQDDGLVISDELALLYAAPTSLVQEAHIAVRIHVLEWTFPRA